jgi:hypothetical protein
MKKGMLVRLSLENGRILVMPMNETGPSLKQLLARVTREISTVRQIGAVPEGNGFRSDC